MKKLLIFLIFMICFDLKSQNKSYVITNSLDTIFGEIKIFGSGNKKNLRRHNNVVNITVNGFERIYTPEEVKSYVFYGLDNKVYKFISIPEMKKNIFFHEITTGKISLYYLYYNHTYDGSDVIFPYVIKDNEYTLIKLLTVRKNFQDFIVDDNELYEEWISTTRNFLELEPFIIRYNDKFRKITFDNKRIVLQNK